MDQNLCFYFVRTEIALKCSGVKLERNLRRNFFLSMFWFLYWILFSTNWLLITLNQIRNHTYKLKTVDWFMFFMFSKKLKRTLNNCKWNYIHLCEGSSSVTFLRTNKKSLRLVWIYGWLLLFWHLSPNINENKIKYQFEICFNQTLITIYEHNGKKDNETKINSREQKKGYVLLYVLIKSNN